MKIAKVSTWALKCPVHIQLAGLDREVRMGLCLVQVETDTGVIGAGMTAITNEQVAAHAVEKVAGPAIIGDDPMNNERIWDKLYWLFSPRGQTGIGCHAIAAIDLAIWDIKGKTLGEPVWRLLGGARDNLPVYATFGFFEFDREQLAEAAKIWVSQGFKGLKMVVGHNALARRDEPRPLDGVIAEDVKRIQGVRDAIGPDIDLYIDGNCGLDQHHALKLARQIEELDISFFEEPITQNDVRGMAWLRSQTSIPLACGQNEGLAFRFRDLLVGEAVDIVQPNAANGGGYTQCARIAGMAAAFNIGMDNGGAWAAVNMHLQGGLTNGGMVEYHYLANEVWDLMFGGVLQPEDSRLTLPTTPGLGLEPNMDVVRDLAI